MSIQKQKIIETLEDLPEELTSQVIDYIEYVKFIYISSKAPEDIVIKDEKDLNKKLKEGIKDIENGNVCSLDEAFDSALETINKQ